MLKVLATDNLSAAGLKALEESPDIDLDVRPPLDEDTLKAELDRYQAVIIRSATKLKRPILEHAKNLELIVRAGVGVDNIDVAAATERGILVANTPQGNAPTTAEHTFAMIASLARHVPQAYSSLKSGAWEKKKFVGTELRGKTLGIVGLGNIGQHVARIGRGYEMTVLGYDPFLSADALAAIGVKKVELDELVSQSDVVTVHCPMTDATRGLIGATEIEKMKRTAFLVNCARGGIVDEEALAEACRAERIRGAAVDVFMKEPVPADHPLLGLPNVIVTPHLGASTREAQEGVAIEASELVLEYAKLGSVRSAINSRVRLTDMTPVLSQAVRLSRSLGVLLGQLVGGAPTRFAVEAFGNEAEKQAELLMLSAAETFFQMLSSESRVNRVNVGPYAESRGVHLASGVRAGSSTTTNGVRVEVGFKREDGTTNSLSASGIVFGPDAIRVQDIDGYELDLDPRGTVLFMRNEDRPGVIGQVGTLLGSHGVNISKMAVTVRPNDRYALGLYQLDGAVPEEVLREMTAWPTIASIRQVNL